MKKLLAIFLVLLLPVGGMADTTGITISVEADENAFVRFAKMLIMLDPAVDAEAAAQDAVLFQQLLDGMTLEMTEQDNAMAMEICVGEQQLLDMTIYDDGNGMYLTSSMMPGYVLKTTAQTPAADAAALEQIDWTGAVLSAYPAADAWLSGLEAQESRGVFIGDAYEGGVKAKTWTLTDQDIAALLDAVLTEDVRMAVDAVLTAYGLEGEDILSELDAMNNAVAAANEYFYMLRAVFDGQDGLVGLSLTVLNQDEQVATFSMGTEDISVRLVIGLGLKKENYWGEWVFTPVDDADAAWAMEGTVREWSAIKETAFANILAKQEPILAYSWRLLVHDTEEEFFSCELQIGQNNNETALRITMNAEPAEDIAAMDANVIICNTDDPTDHELYQKLLNQFTAALTARLIKILPLQNLLEMNQFTMP